MSQFKSIYNILPMVTTSVRLAAVRLKSANKHIFRALLSLASATLLVRVMGLLNQLLVTERFGAGAMMDAYFIATTLPLMISQLLINALEASVIPIYARMRSEGKKLQSALLFSTILNLLLIGTALLIAVMFLFRAQVIHLSAPALDATRATMATGLAAFIYPVILLMVVIGFLECILNSEGQFGWPAYAGLLVPLTTAAFVLFLGTSQGVVTLCTGMVAGLCLQFLLFLLRVRRAKISYRPVLNFRKSEFGAVWILAWPAFFDGLIVQSSSIVDQMFASLLTAGSISALSYSLKLISVPVSVIFVSAGRAALPYLSRQVANNNLKAFKETLRLYLWAISLGTFCLSILLILFSHPLVQLLFQRGAFSAEDTARTASTLNGFAVGLIPMAFGFILSRAFSALGKNRILIGVSIFSVIANVIFDYFLARLLQGEGIALATSAVYTCTMIIMLAILRSQIGTLDFLTPPPELLRVGETISLRRVYRKYITFKTAYSRFNIPYLLVRFGIMITVFAMGIAGFMINSVYTLRIALGSIFILVLIRYRYFLLIVWVILDVLVGEWQIFKGNNFDTGLTAPTLLILFSMPVQQTLKRMPALILLLLYILWVFVGINISPIGVGPFLINWTLFLDYLAVAILTINIITTRERLLRVIDAIIFITIFVSLFGIYGYFTRQYGTIDPVTSLFRAYSIFASAPSLALFLSIVIPLTLYRTFTLQGYTRILGLICILLFLVTTTLTYSRAAFVSIPFSIIILLLFLPSSKMKGALILGLISLAIVVTLLALVSNIAIFSRFLNPDVATFNNRTYLWQALMSRFDPLQLPGQGLQASDVLLANLQIGIIGQGLIATSPSNLFIGTLFDSGIIGLSLLLLVFIVLACNLITGMQKATGEQRTVYVMALAIFGGVFLQSFDANDFWNQSICLYFWLVMALPFAKCWLLTEQPLRIDNTIYEITTNPQIGIIQQEKALVHRF